MNAGDEKAIPYSVAIQRFVRNQPQVYRIVVEGVLDPGWSDRLAGMRIEQMHGGPSNQSVTVLEGCIQDQTQPSGVINTLSGLRLPLLDVELIDDTKTE